MIDVMIAGVILAPKAKLLVFCFAMVLMTGTMVFIAYLPRIFSNRLFEPISDLAIAQTLMGAAYVYRSAYWDFYWIVSGQQIQDPATTNIVLSVVAITSNIFALRARLRTIPEEYAGYYNIFTCCFYPWLHGRWRTDN
jgi:hypothetical protein